MNILLTNDDGYGYEGILILEKIFKNYGNVYVVAPKSIQSGKGCALSSFQGINFERVDSNHFIVDGSPVDCVIFAMSCLNIEFDLVVSGCNDGYNICCDTMYSGTCGACFQALITGKKAIAFSCINKKYYKDIEKQVIEAFEYVNKHNLLSDEYFLNVNLYNPHASNYKGIKITRLFEKKSVYSTEDFNINSGHAKIIRKSKDENCDESYDLNAINSGYISITPLGLSTFKEYNYEKLLQKVR